MTFMRKFLDMLNMDNWQSEDNTLENSVVNEKKQIISLLQAKIDSANKLIDKAKGTSDKTEFENCINEIKLLFSEFSKSESEKDNLAGDKNDNAYGKYYENLKKQRGSNLNIVYEDVRAYDMQPFDLKGKFISDGNFTAIELSGDNLLIAHKCLEEINHMLLLHKYLYEDAELPEKINTEYMLNQKLPISHLRLMPYTATMRKSKYPLCLWLSNSGDYGTEYIYAIYFDREGNIGQCELSLHGSEGVGISYETKIRRSEDELYILRISKTLYSPPYGTTTIYHCRNNESTTRSTPVQNNAKPMSEYDIERYAKECNAYVVREERKEQNNND